MPATMGYAMQLVAQEDIGELEEEEELEGESGLIFLDDEKEQPPHGTFPSLRFEWFRIVVTLIASSVFFSAAVFVFSRSFSFRQPQDVRISHTHGKYWKGWDKVENLFVFGDSYSDVRFDHNGPQPNRSNPIGNPPYPGSTSCNGPNWVDYLVTKYNRTFVRSYDLAYGGSTVSWDTVPSFPMSLDYRHQVAEVFMPYYSDRSRGAPWESDNTLVAVWFGVNDVRGTWEKNTTAMHNEIFDIYGGLLDQLYTSGVRNFLLFNVPPLTLTPDWLSNYPATHPAHALQLAAEADFNAHLRNLSTLFTSSKYPDTTVFELDAHALFSRILKNVSSSEVTREIKNTTGYCKAYSTLVSDGRVGYEQDAYDERCGGLSVKEFFWLDWLHPTFVVHEAVAEEVQRVLR